MALYHERQVAALCGVHCLNALLQQGRVFSELDLAQIAHELDALEAEVLGGGGGGGGTGGGGSANLDESGMFSVQVLTRALQVWGLTALPLGSEELRSASGTVEVTAEQAFICNLQEHWFTIRRVAGSGTDSSDEWWNFNSLYPAPEPLSSFYLQAYLDSLREQGYCIFAVRGELPAPADAADAPVDAGGPGRWWGAAEARAAHKDAQQTRQLGRARNAMEDALARAAAGGGAITLRPGAKRPAGNSEPGDDADADLAAAIAASMRDAAAASEVVDGGTSTTGRSSYAAAARRAQHEPGPAAQTISSSATLTAGDEGDDDPELALALAASMEEHLVQQQQQQQQQEEEEEAVAVPEEPPEDAPGTLLVAFRLPSGERLAARRFLASDSVAAAAAWVQQQLAARGDAGDAAGAAVLNQRHRVRLSSLIPRRELQREQTLAQAGVDDRSMLGVTLTP